MPLDGLKAEQLAYWYFRLNGFFTIRDFVVPPDGRKTISGWHFWKYKNGKGNWVRLRSLKK